MIKFRGKRVDNGEWVKGDRIKYQGDYFITNFANRNSFIGGFEKVIPETIAMYTTINDKERSRFFPNGKEIYGSIEIDGKMSKGGDIIEDSKFNLRYIVCFGESEFGLGWYIKTIPSGHVYRFDKSVTKMEVIGNQTENQELLEAVQ